MRLVAIFIAIISLGCSSSLKVIGENDSGEGIVIMNQNEGKILAHVISYPSRSYSFVLKEIHKFSSKYCGSNFVITERSDIMVVINHECRSGGCGEQANQVFVFEIECPNKVVNADK